MGPHSSRRRHLSPRQGTTAVEDGELDPTDTSSSSSVSSSSQSSTRISSSSTSSSSTSESVSRSTSSTRSSSRSSSSSSSSKTSPSLTSTASSSSTSSVTTERILVTPVPTPTPTPSETTLLFAPFPTSETTDEPLVEPTSVDPPGPKNVGAVSGFWGNKSAVGGVFAVVSLIVLGILAFVVLSIRKKRKGPTSFSDSVYDRFAEPAVRFSDRIPSPGPSTVEMHATSPLEVQDSYRDLFYNNQEPPMQHYDYSAYAQPSFPPQSNHYQGSNNYAYNANDILPSPVPAPAVIKQRTPQQQLPPPSHNLPASLFTSPTRENNTPGKAPVTLQVPVARGSYQPSIDSFYGGSGNVGKSNDPFQ